MNNKNTLTYIAIALGGLVLLLLIVGYMLGWFSRKLGFVEGEGELRYDSNTYYNIARNASISLKGVNVNSDYMKNVAEQLLSLNNNELREVVNQYDQNFSDKEGPTLRALIEGEWVGAFGLCTVSEQQTVTDPCYYQKKAVDRLRSINA